MNKIHDMRLKTPEEQERIARAAKYSAAGATDSPFWQEVLARMQEREEHERSKVVPRNIRETKHY